LCSQRRETKKHIEFTPDDIIIFLEKLRKLVIYGKYIISKNEKRKENMDFIEDYKINTQKEKEILLSLQYEDFCYAVDNEKEKFYYEKLYIFSKAYELDNWGTLEFIDIYIKINMTQTRKGDDFMIIVSFHKRNKDIRYLFK